MSRLAPVVVFVVLVAASARATPVSVIQGDGLVSPMLGELVTTDGVVTAVDTIGFFLQDPVGDGDPATSEGIFVYLGLAPGVVPGDAVRVTGLVQEHVVSFTDTPGLLSTTELFRPWPGGVEMLSRGNVVPEPTRVGRSGRLPPTQLVRPDGIAFWESLEGMLVTVEDAMAVSPRRRSGELAIVANRGADATGLNARGGLTDTAGDENPEWVHVRRDPGIADVTVPFAAVGDRLGDVTGVLDHRSGRYEILATEPLTHVSAGLEPETTTVPVGSGRIHVASFNVHNLDPEDSGPTYAALARRIVENLGAPHVLALQEIQDDDGTPSGALSDEEAFAASSVVSAEQTYARLVEAIVAAGGPRYAVTQVDPEDDRDGGAPGGNIRVAFLYDPEQIELLGPSFRIPGSEDSPGPFDGSRKPLVAEFLAGGERLVLVNGHLSSKFGSAPRYGTGGPESAGTAEREAQAAFIHGYVAGLLDEDPEARVVVLGDLNSFPYESTLPILSGAASGASRLVSLLDGLDPLDRYSFLYGGGSQLLDHALVSPALAAGAMLDIVHVNTEFYGAPSDHDPIVLGLAVGVPEPGTALLFLAGVVVVALRGRSFRKSGAGSECRPRGCSATRRSRPRGPRGAAGTRIPTREQTVAAPLVGERSPPRHRPGGEESGRANP